MARNRDVKVVAAVACPECGAAMGDRCRNPIPETRSRYGRVDPRDSRPGHRSLRPDYVDRRPQPARPHLERRRAWQAQRDRA